MAFCTKCGSQVQDGSAFCTVCGSSVEGNNNNAQQNNGAQPNYGYQDNSRPAPGEGPVTTDRSLVIYILLSIITCGIYGYYFVYTMAKDVNQMCKEDGDKVGGLAAYIILSILTCGLYQYYWLYKIQNRVQAAGYKYNVPIAESGTTVLLWMVIGSVLCGLGAFVGMHIVIKSTNRLGIAYNGRYFGNGF